MEHNRQVLLDFEPHPGHDWAACHRQRRELRSKLPHLTHIPDCVYCLENERYRLSKHFRIADAQTQQPPPPTEAHWASILGDEEQDHQ